LPVVALRFAACATIVVLALAAPVAAQEQPVPPPDTTVAAATTTTIPAGCSAPMPLAAEFLGKVVAGDANVARFEVHEVRQGTLPGSTVDVDYGDRSSPTTPTAATSTRRCSRASTGSGATWRWRS
jgi:hypothetical protein